MRELTSLVGTFMKQNRFLPKVFFLLVCVFSSALLVGSANAGNTGDEPEIPKDKQTSLGLYVTAQEAYEKWGLNSETVKVFDVRTLAEYIFVGHAPMSWNIPLLFQTHEWDVEKGVFTMAQNPDFLRQAMEVASKTDTILVMCRSGGRSAMAVNVLAEAGYSNVYQIIDGMEGDIIDDPESVFLGKHLRNGWKNSGLPWTYDPDPDRVKRNYGAEAMAIRR